MKSFMPRGGAKAVAVVFAALSVMAIDAAATTASADRICATQSVRGTSSPSLSRQLALSEARKAWRDVARNEHRRSFKLVYALDVRGSPGCEKSGRRYTCHVVAHPCYRASVAILANGEQTVCDRRPDHRTARANGCKWFRP